VARGNRTCIFSDAQYAAILDAVWIYDPEFIPAATRKTWQQRIRTFIELLRWSAMDLVDAIEFRSELLTGNVLRYRRQKTGILATVKLPDHVVAMLRSVPLEPGDIGPEKPFRTKGTAQNSNVWKWQHRLIKVFELAGIDEVQTDMRTRKPHCKMLRDTAAVWWLRHGVPVHSVSKALGHSSVITTERAYLPWVKELEDSHLEQMDKVMAAAAPVAPRAVTVIRRKR
jgi:integrase